MKARVQWLDGRAFVGESGSGHAVVMDGSPESGGRNIGVRPMEMLLLGLGGCTAFDIVMILERMREKVTGLDIALEGERASGGPQGLHPCEADLQGHGPQAEARECGARGEPFGGEILLRHRHVRQDRQDRAQLRDHRRGRGAQRLISPSAEVPREKAWRRRRMPSCGLPPMDRAWRRTSVPARRLRSSAAARGRPGGIQSS